MEKRLIILERCQYKRDAQGSRSLRPIAVPEMESMEKRLIMLEKCQYKRCKRIKITPTKYIGEDRMWSATSPSPMIPFTKGSTGQGEQ